MIATKMKRLSIHHYVLATCMIAGLSGIGSIAEAKIKCWKNNESVRECGNSVPPEFAQQGHDEVSSRGVRLDSTVRAKSLEELQAERATAKAQAEAEVRRREQAAKDRVLLDTFSSDDDMLLARDGQIMHLESQIKLTESHTNKLNNGLEELIQDAADHERRGDEPPEKLVGDIDSLREQISDNQTFIKTKQTERVELMRKFEADIARFRELKGHTS